VVGAALADASGLAANYQLVEPGALSASISPRPLPVEAVIANDKLYDGSTAATLAARGKIAPVAGDAVQLETAAVSASFTDSAVGSSKPVLLSGYAVSGADAANYTLLPPGPLSANISSTPLPPLDPQPAQPLALPVLCLNFPTLPTIDLATGELSIMSGAAGIGGDGGSDAAHGTAAGVGTGSGGCQLSVSAKE